MSTSSQTFIFEKSPCIIANGIHKLKKWQSQFLSVSFFYCDRDSLYSTLLCSEHKVIYFHLTFFPLLSEKLKITVSDLKPHILMANGDLYSLFIYWYGGWQG